MESNNYGYKINFYLSLSKGFKFNQNQAILIENKGKFIGKYPINDSKNIERNTFSFKIEENNLFLKKFKFGIIERNYFDKIELENIKNENGNGLIESKEIIWENLIIKQFDIQIKVNKLININGIINGQKYSDTYENSLKPNIFYYPFLYVECENK